MTMEQAEKLGWLFTGATWSIFDRECEARYKNEAKQIKDKYKGADFRIVTGSSRSWLSVGHKAILGNEIYLKVQFDKEDQLRTFINNYESKKKKLSDEYEAKLAQLQKEHDEAVELYTEICALKK